MAPKVHVPADFGRHHVGAPSHGNLTFNLKEGVQIIANSIIMSLNSPVIDDLTTNLQLMSLEADDFGKEAVDCFIEASYTGEVEALNKGIFREVNKMAHVFKVDWLVAKCEKFFFSYLGGLDDESSYDEIIFAVDEAMYLMSTLKKRDLLNLAVGKINTNFSPAMLSNFLTWYLSDFPTCSKLKLDASIAMSSKKINVLIEVLLVNLEKREFKNLDANSRYLLEKIDIACCTDLELHAKLFTGLERIECIEKEDYKLFLSLHKTVTSKSCKPHTSALYLDPLPYSKDFSQATDFETVFQKLASSPIVDSLYSFFDALWYKLFQGGERTKVTSEELKKKIIAVKEERRWDTMYLSYVDSYYSDSDTQLLKFAVRDCNELVCRVERECTRILLCDYITSEAFVKKYFLQNSSSELKLPYTKYKNKKFVFSTTAMTDDDPDTFGMKLERVEGDQTASEQMPQLHIALQCQDKLTDGNCGIIPISWSGKPICDMSKTYWYWGPVSFHNRPFKDEEMISSKSGPLDIRFDYVNESKDSAYRLIAYMID